MLSLIGISKQEQILTTVANLNLFAKTNTENVGERIETPTFNYALYTPIGQIEAGIQQSFEAKKVCRKDNCRSNTKALLSLQEHSVQNEKCQEASSKTKALEF